MVRWGCLWDIQAWTALFSGEFNVISKLVIIAMMIRGRHRGLPYTIDRAIMLPNAAMKRHDRLQEEHAINRHNTMERTNHARPCCHF